MKWMVRVLMALGVVAALAAAVWLVLDRPWTIEYYRETGDRTLVVAAASGTYDWTRVTSIVETSSTVVITVTSFRPPLPGTGGPNVEFTAQLKDPLADRSVIDASSGLPVREVISP